MLIVPEKRLQRLTQKEYATLAASMEHGRVMLPEAQFDADVVLVGPREFEVTKSLRTYREKNFTSFVEQLDLPGFQANYLRRINESLGLEALAPYLRRSGLKVATLNCNVAPHTTAQLVDKIARSGARVVGVSMIYRPQVAEAVALINALRDFPEIVVVAGGALASYMREQLLLRLKGLSAVIYGEAEETFAAVAAAVVSGAEWRDLPGVALRAGGNAKVNRAAPPLALRSILPPARDTLGYLRVIGKPTRIASIYTSRGCMAQCVFCTGKDAYNVLRPPTYRFRDPQDVVDEMETLNREFGVQFVYINDDNFLGYGRASYQRVREFAAELTRRKLDLQFATECRVDGLDEPTLVALKKAGMVQVLLGIESGSDGVLKRWRKGATVKQNQDAVDLMRRLRINVEPGFILFDAHTTVAELSENLSFLRTTGLLQSPFPLYLLNRLSVYPGTAIEPSLVNEGVLTPSEIRRDGSFEDDPSAIVREFERLEYLSKDHRTELVWRALRSAIEPFERAVEELIPKATAVLAKVRGSKAEPELRLLSGRLIHAVASWRRHLGDLLSTMLGLCIQSYECGYAAAQLRWLRRSLEQAGTRYNLQHLESSFEGFFGQVAKLAAVLSVPVGDDAGVRP